MIFWYDSARVAVVCLAFSRRIAAFLGFVRAGAYRRCQPRSRSRSRSVATPYLAGFGFDLAVDGHTWHATYDPKTGSQTGRSADVPSREISFRDLMVKLHEARGFPDYGGVRWYWALQVDAAAILMMLWALTGLVMWWQQKRLRKPGAVILVGGGVAAILLISGMHGGTSNSCLTRIA